MCNLKECDNKSKWHFDDVWRWTLQTHFHRSWSRKESLQKEEFKDIENFLCLCFLQHNKKCWIKRFTDKGIQGLAMMQFYFEIMVLQTFLSNECFMFYLTALTLEDFIHSKTSIKTNEKNTRIDLQLHVCFSAVSMFVDICQCAFFSHICPITCVITLFYFCCIYAHLCFFIRIYLHCGKKIQTCCIFSDVTGL